MRRLVRYAGLAGRAPAPAPQLPTAGAGAHEPLPMLGHDLGSDGANAAPDADGSSDLVIRGVVFDVRWPHLLAPPHARAKAARAYACFGRWTRWTAR